MLHPELSRVENILLAQGETYEKVFKNEPDFHLNFHYDWWVFPIQVPSTFVPSQRAKAYSITCAETLELLNHQQFRDTYVACLKLYLESQKDTWNGYHIRFTKAMFSMEHFIRLSLNSPELIDFNQKLIVLAKLGLDLDKKHGIELDRGPMAFAMNNKAYKAIGKMEALLKEIYPEEKSKLKF